MQSEHTTAATDAPPRPVLKLKTRPAPADTWVTWRVGGPRPKQRHASLADALAERDRLAHLHPGERFETFQCVFVSAQQVRP
jgi:hypothetical protein